MESVVAVCGSVPVEAWIVIGVVAWYVVAACLLRWLLVPIVLTGADDKTDVVSVIGITLFVWIISPVVLPLVLVVLFMITGPRWKGK